MMLPILISVSLAPGSYFFWAIDSLVENTAASISGTQTKSLDVMLFPLVQRLVIADIVRRKTTRQGANGRERATITYVISRTSVRESRRLSEAAYDTIP